MMRLYEPADCGKDGTTLRVPELHVALVTRFFRKVEKDVDPCGCWVWTASRRSDGYGQFALAHGLIWRAHRVAYMLRHGGLPDDLVLDHLCRNRACVNPDHLEPVTPAENVRRGVADRWTGFCKRGHPWSDENTYKRGAHRECRVCHRDRERARRRRR